MSDANVLGWAVAVIVGLIAAQLKLFSINRTLIAILTELRADKRGPDKRATEYTLKMILFQLRGDKHALEQLEQEHNVVSDSKQIKPEVLERLRQKGMLPKA